MLILSRKRDEVIMIGDDIRITVTDIRGDKVRLGIDAPQSVRVHRLEVYEEKQREQQDIAKARALQAVQDCISRAEEEYDR